MVIYNNSIDISFVAKAYFPAILQGCRIAAIDHNTIHTSFVAKA